MVSREKKGIMFSETSNTERLYNITSIWKYKN